MSRIDLSKVDSVPMQTSFWYGVLRTGKTRFCCTFPRVAWFGTEREGGYKTIKYMDRESFYEPDYPPQVYLIKQPAEFMEHLRKDVLPQVARGLVKTIVIELSVYSDEVIRARADEQGWLKYQDLETHILHVDALLKRTPGVRVCYNSLAVSEDDKAKPSGVLIAGKALPRKLPALMDVVGYLRAEGTADGQTVDRFLHLAPFSNFPAGHRYGERMPPLVRNPTYRMLEALLAGNATCDKDGNVAMTAAKPLISLPPIK